jgi:hypothetical protein
MIGLVLLSRNQTLMMRALEDSPLSIEAKMELLAVWETLRLEGVLEGRQAQRSGASLAV